MRTANKRDQYKNIEDLPLILTPKEVGEVMLKYINMKI